eukprot:364200-Chlamydomonas_euryale.AAC.8
MSRPRAPHALQGQKGTDARPRATCGTPPYAAPVMFVKKKAMPCARAWTTEHLLAGLDLYNNVDRVDFHAWTGLATQAG